MKILVWGINYAPEVSGIAPFNTALCEFLASRGHAVTMLTTFPYYPQWKKRPEDSGKLWRAENEQRGPGRARLAVCSAGTKRLQTNRA